jgi:hypothetical protein
MAQREVVVHQGDVYWVAFAGRGSEPWGRRPALVLQHDRLNRIYGMPPCQGTSVYAKETAICRSRALSMSPKFRRLIERISEKRSAPSRYALCGRYGRGCGLC